MDNEYLHAFEWAPVGMLVFESGNETSEVPEEWVCKVANSAAGNLLGRLPLDGHSLAALFPPAIAASLADGIATNPLSKGLDFFVSNPGTWLLASGNRVANRLTVSLIDITAQKEAAFTDHKMLNLYRSLSHSLYDNEIILYDKEFNVVLTEGEPRFIRLNIQEDLKGQNLMSLFEQNEFSFLGEYISHTFGGVRNEVEREINGKFFKASVFMDGRDDNGQENVVGVLLLKDVTELHKKHRELELRVQQLDRSNKELEQFAYVASHDLHEPLRKIMSFGDRLMRKYSEALPEEGQMYLNRIGEAARRMERLLDDLLIFSRATRSERAHEPTDLQQTLVNVLDDLPDIEQKNAQIKIPHNLPVIEAVPSHMQQLFQNIINNALKFSKPNQVPVIEIRCRHVSGNEVAQQVLDPDKPHCVIEFEDNGIGFDQENAERIFNVFQRLHGRSEYSGSGVGLAICKKIVETYGGAMFAKSASGHGFGLYGNPPF